MSSFKDTTEESRIAWERNADFWDDKMGDQSNYFHCNIVRPRTENLLDIQQGDFVHDIACSYGNFSQRLVENGAKVVAFDFSEKLISHAKRRRVEVLNEMEFNVCDATNYDQLMHLKRETPFNKAVANMAIMDISYIEPLMQAVYEMLSEDGIFVFSTHHPCFVKPDHTYATACVHKGIAIKGQPALQNYYHRSLQDLFGICRKAGFVMDGFYEETDDNEEYPVIVIVRLRK